MTRQWPFSAVSRALSRAHSTTTTTTTTTTSSFPLKHVTKSNFDAALADLRNHVRSADFVAIDLEMTGLTSAPWRESLEFDRFDVKYLKVKDSAEKFAVVQFGVCPFRWDPLRLSFIAHPHNFFVFPRQELLRVAGGPSYEFLCQTTSMDFLAKYQFDFNACIYEGISYLSREQEKELLQRLNFRYDNELLEDPKEVRDMPLVSITDVLFSERMKIRLSEWRDGLLREGNSHSLQLPRTLENESKQQFQTIFFKMHPAVSLNGFTAHQLRLIQLVTKKHFKDLAYVRLAGENSCSEQFVVYIESEDDKDLLVKEVKNEQHREAERKIKDAIGIRHVIDLISSEKKLIVGHNCFLDFAHIHSKFLGPLPLSTEKFVASVNKYFPYIIDTKILLNANGPLQQRMKKSRTSLSSAFALLCPQIAFDSNKSLGSGLCPSFKVEVQVDDMRSSSWNSGSKHEAGYDAFMTGCIFAQACSHLGIDFKQHLPSDNLAHNENLQKHLNLLYLSWINGDIINLSTGKRIAASLGSRKIKRRDPKIVFENIVLIWRFPSKLKAREIKECISMVFGPTSVMHVYHLDETAVFVQFSKAELVSEFLTLKESLENMNNVISVLHPLSKLLEGGNTCAADYETYKEICSSSISEVLFADQAEALGFKWKTKLKESEVQEHASFHKENAVNTESLSVGREEMGKELVDNSPSGRVSCDETIDSIYAAEIKQARAINL